MRRNKSDLPRHCSWNLDREGGKPRVRFRKKGFSTYIYGTPMSEGFLRQYWAAMEGVKAERKEIGAERTIGGSVDALIVSYYKLVFPTLKASTQGVRRNILERFRAEHGRKPVARIEHQHVAAIVAAKANTPSAANNLGKVLHHLFEHAIAINMRTSNPVRGVKKFKESSDGIHTWTEEEVAQFIARHPIGSRAHLALMLMLWTGQRRSDAVRMGWQHVRNGKIAVRQEKTDAPLLIPIAPELADALALVPRTNMTFLLTKYGAPFTPGGFGDIWFRARCDEAGLPQCSAHGLRKLCATRLAELGCSERQIMAITGHKTVSEVSRYTKAAEQAKLAEQAMAKLSERTKQHAELSSIPIPLDKTAAK
jgi:integrase